MSSRSTSPDSPGPTATSDAIFAGGGRAGELVRNTDWSRTPLGPIAQWPSSLRTTVGTLLHSRHPMFLWWGPELVQVYNDAYTPSFGNGKHPTAMGQRGRECWAESWSIIGPQIDAVMTRGEPSWNEDALVPIFRNGRIEEVYWTYGYSPVFDDGGRIGGTLVVCTETTTRVIAERRLRTVHSLADRTSVVADAVALAHATFEVLRAATSDVPFALLASLEGPDGAARAEGASNVPDAAALLDAVARAQSATFVVSGSSRTRSDAPLSLARAGLLAMPGGPWPEPASNAYVVPIDAVGPPRFLVFGLSPRLPFDPAYRVFLTEVAEQVELTLARIEARSAQEKGSREREKLLAELESANRAKDEFLAMLGHELRNPLAPIVTAVELMKLRGEDSSVREREIIERQATHLVGLVDDLLDVSRVARGKVDLRRERVAVADVIDRAVETVTPLLERKRHALHLDVQRLGLDVDGDLGRLSQVVANVLTNAAKYTDAGGRISVTAARDAGSAVVRIADNGSGISGDQLPRLFDAFFQGPRARDRAEGGLGLGLTLVRSLVELHGGTVAARSEGVGKGTEIELRLPLSAHEAPINDRPSPHEDMPATDTGLEAHPRRVLLVDDNEDLTELFAMLLRSVGHVVEVAADGPSAHAIAAKFRPEVAVVDIGLPVMDGYDLAAHLRASFGAEQLRLVAMTGYGQAGDRERSRAAGFDVHLVKPVDGDALLACIRKSDAGEGDLPPREVSSSG